MEDSSSPFSCSYKTHTWNMHVQWPNTDMVYIYCQRENFYICNLLEVKLLVCFGVRLVYSDVNSWWKIHPLQSKNFSPLQGLSCRDSLHQAYSTPYPACSEWRGNIVPGWQYMSACHVQRFPNPWLYTCSSNYQPQRCANEMVCYLTDRGLQLLQSVRSSVRKPFAALNVVSFLSCLELDGYSQGYFHQTSH